MKRYLVCELSDVTSPNIHRHIKNHKPTDICITHAREVIYPVQIKEISELQNALGLPFTVLQFASSGGSDDYTTIPLEWCAHTGWIWEHRFCHSWVRSGITPASHNTSGYRESNTYDDYRKFLIFMGKVRFPNRILLWDALIASGILNTSTYSYYDLLPHSTVASDRDLYINELCNILLTDPDSWHRYQSQADFDLTSQLPDSAPGVNNLFHSGYPTNPDIYQHTSASLITETTSATSVYHRVPFLTEKTYRAIQNYHPFWCWADPGTDHHLQSLGYETFGPEFGDPPDMGELLTQIYDLYAARNTQDSDLQKMISDTIRRHTDYFYHSGPENFDIICKKTQHNRYNWYQQVVSEQRLINNCLDGDVIGIHTNKPIHNLCDYMYDHHSVYITDYQP